MSKTSLIAISEVHKVVRKAKTYEDFVSIGLLVREWKDKSQFVLGELASMVAVKYGEKSLQKYAKEIGIPYNSLRVYRWVVKTIKEKKLPIIPHLSFSHYVLVVRRDDAKKWLLKSADNNWSFEKLATEIRKKKLPEPEKKEKNIYECPFCHKVITESELIKLR